MYKEIIDIDGTKAAFLRAVGGESSSPVVTPGGPADSGVTFLSNLMSMIKPRLATGGQEYGLASEYAKRAGRSLNMVKDWLRNLYKPGGIRCTQKLQTSFESFDRHASVIPEAPMCI